MNHKRIVGDVHRGYSAEVANAAALAALTGFGGVAFTADDVGRTVRQLDNEAIWRLTGVSPVAWHQDNAGGTAATFAGLVGAPDDNAALAAALAAASAFPDWKDLPSEMKWCCGKELLSAPITSTSTIASTEAGRWTMPTLQSGQGVHFRLMTTSAAGVATNARRAQIGYQTAADAFVSIGQYLTNNASSAAVRAFYLLCMANNGDGTSDYIIWGADGVVAPILATGAPSALVLRLNLWVDTSGDSITAQSLTGKLTQRG